MLIAFFTFPLRSEVVFRGKVNDLEGRTLQGIIVRLYDDENLKGFATTKKDGVFRIAVDSISLPARLTFASKSYGSKEIWTDITSDTINVTLTPEAYTLNEVVVKVPHARMKGDTITYDVASYTNKGDRSIEDIIKKLPGIQVDEDGTISYEGETINNFYIEGLNLMGSNYVVATRGINPADISTVSVYERHQPKKVLKNVAESKKAALNLKLKKNRMLKPLGYVKGGAGYGDDMLWLGELYSMFVAPNNQTIISAKGNNNGVSYSRFNLGTDVAAGMLSQTPFGTPPISENRYLDNNSAYFTANTLLRPKEDFTVTVNSSYGLEHSVFDGESKTEYLMPGSEDISYQESVGNHIKNHIVMAGIKAERNSESFYFSDQFAFRGSFSNNDYDVANSQRIRQRQDADNYVFYNGLSVIVKRHGKVYEINSETRYDNTPVSNMSATDFLNGSLIVGQTAKGRRFFNRETTSLSWVLGGRSTFGLQLAFEIGDERFKSIECITSTGQNDISGYGITATVSPFYKYAVQGRFSAQLSVPVGFDVKRYKDRLEDVSHNYDKIYPDLKLDVFYKINQFQHIDLSGAWSHFYGGFKDLITGEVYTTFRSSIVMGVGTPDRGDTKQLKASYYYRNPIEGFYLSATLGGSLRRSDRLGVSDVSAGGTSSGSAAVRNHISTVNAVISASKDVRPWHTSFSLNANALVMERKTRRSGVDVNVSNSMYIVTGKVETHQFNDVLAGMLNVSYTLNHLSFKGIMPSYSLDELSLNGKVSVFPVRGFEIYGRVYLNRSETDESHYKTNVFVDGGVSCSIHKFDLELTARNLTGMRNYSYTAYHTLDITTYRYTLRPLEFFLTLRYNF